ncbi:MAG TPA: BolA family transcriptional regulator [Myxococcales bacterium]|nr:BolA family transcriptional regulator [Myxococcales bacterium]HAN31100.1 BolA family transcriptional regulator [Myxococcales bacterium]|tara:strand:+ start:135 stop:359 length:225 start_codon:yes stop_codon:yes gene_type:complete
MYGFIEQKLNQAFPDSQIDIRDTTGGGDHFAVEIESSAFEGKSRIEQHRMVYDALGERVGHEIHALALRTKCPS